MLSLWLKSEFIENTFSKDLYPIIKDVKLLSKNDILKYINKGLNSVFLKTGMTDYALSKNIYKIYTNEDIYTWWLSDKISYNSLKNLYATSDGRYENEKPVSGAYINGLRPVLVIAKDGNYELLNYDYKFEYLDSDEIPPKKVEIYYDSKDDKYGADSYNGYSYNERQENSRKTWGNSWRCEIQKRYNCTGLGYAGYANCKK